MSTARPKEWRDSLLLPLGVGNAQFRGRPLPFFLPLPPLLDSPVLRLWPPGCAGAVGQIDHLINGLFDHLKFLSREGLREGGAGRSTARSIFLRAYIFKVARGHKSHALHQHKIADTPKSSLTICI